MNDQFDRGPNWPGVIRRIGDTFEAMVSGIVSPRFNSYMEADSYQVADFSMPCR